MGRPSIYARERAVVKALVRRRAARAVPELRVHKPLSWQRLAVPVLLGLTLALVAAVSR